MLSPSRLAGRFVVRTNQTYRRAYGQMYVHSKQVTLRLWVEFRFTFAIVV